MQYLDSRAIEQIEHLEDAGLPDDEKLTALTRYLQSIVRDGDADPTKRQVLAYGAAGLITTNFVRNLDSSSLYSSILSIASELELPIQHRSTTATWEAWKKLINELPKVED